MLLFLANVTISYSYFTSAFLLPLVYCIMIYTVNYTVVSDVDTECVCFFVLVQTNLQRCGRFLACVLKSSFSLLSSSSVSANKQSSQRKKLWKKKQSLCEFYLEMWRSSNSNSTTFELRTLSTDSKFVEFFKCFVVECEFVEKSLFCDWFLIHSKNSTAARQCRQTFL